LALILRLQHIIASATAAKEGLLAVSGISHAASWGATGGVTKVSCLRRRLGTDIDHIIFV
jgi:hypothetical protein